MSITHIGAGIQSLLKDNKDLKNAYATHQVKKIIGEKLGAFFIKKGVEVKYIRNKTLYLVCPYASIKSEIQLRKNILIEAVNKSLHNMSIDEIVILNV